MFGLLCAHEYIICVFYGARAKAWAICVLWCESVGLMQFVYVLRLSVLAIIVVCVLTSEYLCLLIKL